MRVALLDYKHYTWCGEHFIKSCGSFPIKIEDEDVISNLPNHEEILCAYQNEAGEYYVKAETGSRAGRVWSLPRNVNAIMFHLTKTGPIVVYRQPGDKTGTLVLV